MLFDLAALWLIVWIFKNAAMDVSCAVTGKPNPRYELKKAKARAAGQAPPAQPRYGTRDWFNDLLADGLQAQTEWRRRKAAEKRTARELAEAEQADAEQTGGAQQNTDPAPADPAPEQTSGPGAGGAPDPEQTETPRPQPTADEPTARIYPFPIPQEDNVSTTVNGEVVGLDQSIAYAKGLAAFAGEHGAAGNEGYIGHLTQSKVTGAGLSSAQEMQEAFATAQAAAAKHAKELERQRSVQEAYDSTPDAGDKDFQQQGR